MGNTNDLWAKIQEFEIDDPESSLTFSKRLARENEWTHPFALRAIEEYKKFVYLAVISGHPVTPSIEVDQVWHLHLTYTKSYWEDFCGGVLGRPFHHNPTKGGKQEGEKFDKWYNQTLESYRQYFGQEPPADLWPPAEMRFSKSSLIRQVSNRTHWVVRKPNMSFSSRGLAIMVALMGIGGCASLNDAIVNSDYFVFLILIVIVSLIFYVFRNSGGGGGKGGDGGCSSCAATGCSWFSGCSSDSGCGGSGCSGCGGGGCGGCGS
ncbi:MAG: hypothetical protein KC931_12545 [Candidatus Omnitrophica bacterium]|nr:hypothetical protein [Candidatus Omnitrophota bacterium]